jgi:predicted nucleotidyltransferase
MKICDVQIPGSQPISAEQIGALCQRHGIRRLSLFGSILRNDFGPDSDVDILIEFEPGQTPGWKIVDIEEEISKLFGNRRADIVNPKYLNVRLKDSVLASAEVIYDKG